MQRGRRARGTYGEERLGTDSDNSWGDTRLGGRRGSCGEKRREERERETINMCKQLYNEVPLIGLIKFQVINGWHC